MKLGLRRREKFVLASIILSVGLAIVQYVPVEWRLVAIGIFSLVVYFFSALVLSEDLNYYEWFTILPLPALYAGAVGWFYFLLPEHFLSRLLILGLFALGMYAIYLTANIFSVAKGRTVQLLYAAHASSLIFTLLISFMVSSTIFSIGLPLYVIVPALAIVHFILIFMVAWSVNLKKKDFGTELILSGLLTWLVVELSIALSFFPFKPWHFALFIMILLYIGLGIIHNYLQERLFEKTLKEYVLVAVFGFIVFLLVLPGK